MRILLMRFLFSLFLIMALSINSWAEDNIDFLKNLSFEEILNVEFTISSASKFEQPITRAPASVTVITAEEIKRYGYRSLGDILNSVRSFHTYYHPAFQVSGVRGYARPAEESRVLMMVDGNRINDAIYDAVALDNNLWLDVDLIERVEIVRGPNSSLYGTSALFALINIITKRGVDMDGVELSATLGTPDINSQRVSHGAQWDNGVETLVSVSRGWNGGENIYFPNYDTPENNNGVAEKYDNEGYERLFSRLSYKGFTAQFAFSASSKQSGAGDYHDTFNQASTFYEYQNRYLNLAYQHDFAHQLKLHSKFYLGEYRYNGDFYNLTKQPMVRNVDDYEAKWWGTSIELAQSLTKHNWVIGFEVQRNYHESGRNYDVLPIAEDYFSFNNTGQRWAAFIQDEYLITDAFTLNASLRFDHYSSIEDAFTPRLALIYQVSDASTLKFLYGKAFRAPSAFERGAGEIGDLQFAAESIENYEIGLEHRFNDELSGLLSVYQYHLDKRIAVSEDAALKGGEQSANLPKFSAQGIELELNGEWDDWGGRLSYAWQDNKDEITQTHLDYSPQHLAKLQFFYRLPRVTLAWQTLYASHMTTGRTDLEKIASYNVSQLSLLSYAFKRQLEISAGIYNIFEQTYRGPVGGTEDWFQAAMPQPKRHAILKLTYRY